MKSYIEEIEKIVKTKTPYKDKLLKGYRYFYNDYETLFDVSKTNCVEKDQLNNYDHYLTLTKDKETGRYLINSFDRAQIGAYIQGEDYSHNILVSALLLLEIKKEENTPERIFNFCKIALKSYLTDLNDTKTKFLEDLQNAAKQRFKVAPPIKNAIYIKRVNLAKDQERRCKKTLTYIKRFIKLIDSSKETKDNIDALIYFYTIFFNEISYCEYFDKDLNIIDVIKRIKADLKAQNERFNKDYESAEDKEYFERTIKTINSNIDYLEQILINQNLIIDFDYIYKNIISIKGVAPIRSLKIQDKTIFDNANLILKPTRPLTKDQQEQINSFEEIFKNKAEEQRKNNAKITEINEQIKKIDNDIKKRQKTDYIDNLLKEENEKLNAAKDSADYSAQLEKIKKLTTKIKKDIEIEIKELNYKKESLKKDKIKIENRNENLDTQFKTTSHNIIYDKTGTGKTLINNKSVENRNIYTDEDGNIIISVENKQTNESVEYITDYKTAVNLGTEQINNFDLVINKCIENESATAYIETDEIKQISFDSYLKQTNDKAVNYHKIEIFKQNLELLSHIQFKYTKAQIKDESGTIQSVEMKTPEYLVKKIELTEFKTQFNELSATEQVKLNEKYKIFSKRGFIYIVNPTYITLSQAIINNISITPDLLKLGVKSDELSLLKNMKKSGKTEFKPMEHLALDYAAEDKIKGAQNQKRIEEQHNKRIVNLQNKAQPFENEDIEDDLNKGKTIKLMKQ